MRKMLPWILSILLMISLTFPVCAAGGTVSDLSVSGNTTQISVSGTTTGVTAAVAVQVLDSGSNIVAMENITISGNTFSGSLAGLTLTSGATYTVRAADYDGGTWKTTTITVTSPVTPAPPSGGTSGSSSSSSVKSNPTQNVAATTGDSTPVGMYVILLLTSVAVLVYLGRKKFKESK